MRTAIKISTSRSRSLPHKRSDHQAEGRSQAAGDHKMQSINHKPPAITSHRRSLPHKRSDHQAEGRSQAKRSLNH
ncbi:MAG: hypothetical protein ACI8VT_001295 [Saprospiraceae bacterium]|jgi:hypothetical protein